MIRVPHPTAPRIPELHRPACRRDARSSGVAVGRNTEWHMRAAGRPIPSIAIALLIAGALLSCSSGGSTGPTSVTRVTVTPDPDTVAVGNDVTLHATAFDAHGNVVTGAQIFWNTQNAQIATVSGSGAVTGVAPGSVQISASAAGVSGLSTVVVIPPPVASVHITQASPSVTVGQTITLDAVLLDAHGDTLTGRAIAWSSGDTTKATVDPLSGIVTGVSPGGTTITATCEGKSATVPLTVLAQVAASVIVSPDSVGIIVGQTAQLTATVKTASGTVISGAVVTWTIDNGSIASVSSNGLVTGLAVGKAAITATSGAAHARVPVTVAPVPANKVIVSPSSITLLVTQTSQFSAVVTDSLGNPLSGRAITWSSSRTAIATVSGSGLVTAVAPGVDTIKATSSGITGFGVVTVKLVPVASVQVTPSTAPLFVGDTVRLTATTYDSVGGVLTGRTITWSSAAPGIASVSATGLVTGVSPGGAVIKATSEGQVGTATITVSLVPVKTIVVTPALDTLLQSASVQLAATLLDSAGDTLTGRSVTWSSDNTSVAVVGSNGSVFAQGPGTATITAASGSASGTATIVVLAPIASVTLSPKLDTIQLGATVQYTATLKDAQGNVLTGRAITWRSIHTGVASIDTDGLATAVAPGGDTIIASSGGKADSATLIVVPVPVSAVLVTPNDTTLTMGDSVQLAATTLDSKGDTLTGRAVTWSSSDTTIATVSATGVTVAVAPGSVTITAMSESASGTASITVTPAVSPLRVAPRPGVASSAARRSRSP